MSMRGYIMFVVNSVYGKKMDANELCLWDIEKMVKYCRGYFKVSKFAVLEAV